MSQAGDNAGEKPMIIWKWEITIARKETLMLPAGAKIIDVQMVYDKCCLWALCDESAPDEPRLIMVHSDGDAMGDDPGQYIATFQTAGGDRAFHAFDATGTEH